MLAKHIAIIAYLIVIIANFSSEEFYC